MRSAPGSRAILSGWNEMSAAQSMNGVAGVSFRGCGLVLGWTGIDAGENIPQSRRGERTRSPSSMGKFIYPRHPSWEPTAKPAVRTP